MIVGLIIVPLVSLLTPRMDSRDISAIFSCYDNLVEATTKKVLPDDQSFDSPAFKRERKNNIQMQQKLFLPRCITRKGQLFISFRYFISSKQ